MLDSMTSSIPGKLLQWGRPREGTEISKGGPGYGKGGGKGGGKGRKG